MKVCARAMAAPVAVIGVPVVDMVGHVESFPDPGGHSPGITLDFAPGGPAVNVATGVARLGHRSTLLGKIGTDRFGEFLRAALERDGVTAPECFVVHDAPTAVVLVLHDRFGAGEMRSFSFRGGTADTMLCEGDVEPGQLAGVKALFVDGILALDERLTKAGEHAGRMAREAGIRTFFDPNLRVPGDTVPGDMADRVSRLISVCDEVLMNEREARMLTRERSVEGAAKQLAQQHSHIKCWVIKRGGDGCVVACDGGLFAHPAFRVAVSDTSGAGDSFDAAWIVSYLEGRSRGAAAEFASAVAALTVSGTGAWKSLPTREQALRFAEGHRGDIGE